MSLTTGQPGPTLLHNELSRQVRAAFDTLVSEGQDTHGVAQYLMRLGIEGERLNGGLDPLAQYLMRSVREVSVYISPTVATCRRHGQRAIEVPLPGLLAQFIAEFDDGAHDCVAVTGV